MPDIHPLEENELRSNGLMTKTSPTFAVVEKTDTFFRHCPLRLANENGVAIADSANDFLRRSKRNSIQMNKH